MKKYSFLLFVLLASCTDKKCDLCGTWRMKQVEINGAKMHFEQIGKPVITFNTKGDYVLEMNGQHEKGSYLQENEHLTLTPASVHKPKQVLVIEHIDSLEVRYYSQTDKNRMNVLLHKSN